MRNKTSMMQPTNFTDFNPLDVLAAAASLQRRTEESAEDEESNENHKTGSGASAEGDDDDTQDGADDEDGAVDKPATVSCGVTVVENEKQLVQEKATEQCSAEQDAKVVTTEAAPVPSGSTETGHLEPLNADASESDQIARGSGNRAPSTTVSTICTIKTPLVSKYDRASVPITPPPVHRVVGAAIGANGTRTSQMVTDHSYAFVAQLQSLKAEEDEGYSSRSSLDDDSEETVSRLNHKNAQFLTGWVGRPSTSCLRPHKATMVSSIAATSTATNSKQDKSVSEVDTEQTTKVMITSKDSKLQRSASGLSVGNDGIAQLNSASNGSSIMLRTLLGQKVRAAPTTAQRGQSKIIIAGGLSGRVINVLKSGSIALAPPEKSQVGTKQQQPETGSLLVQSTDKASKIETTKHQTTMSTSQHTVIESAIVSGAITNTGDNAVTENGNDQSAQAGPVHSDCGAHGITASSINLDNEEESILFRAGQKQSKNQLEVSSHHGSEGVTEDDETSCDSSKCDIMVDTTPVMSPNMDFTSPLMSPVCERDVPMMSPMVGSPEIMCDIFKLPSCIKQHVLPMDSSPLLSEEQCNLTVSCVISADVDGSVHTKDPTAGTDSGVPVENEETPVETAIALPTTPTAEGNYSHGTQQEVDNKPEGSGVRTSNSDSSSEVSAEHSDTSHGNDVTQAIGNSPSQPTEQDYIEVAIPTPPTTPSTVISLTPVSELCTEDPDLTDDQHVSGILQAEEEESILPSITDKSCTPDPLSSSLRNQYIIEDDESPVAKFGTPRSILNEDVSDGSGTSPPLALAISCSSPSGSMLGGIRQSLVETSGDSTVSPVKPHIETTPSGSESVKVIMTKDTSNKSLFTAVRRPLVTGMKALPGSLHMVPVVPSTKVTSGLMHMLPVSGARGLVTQIIPKVGRSQFITGLPVLSGKTVVLPDNGKGRMNTLLVPVSIGGSPSSSAPISLVQTTTKTKLANLQHATLKTVDTIEEAEPILSPKVKTSELSSPLIFHGRITPISTTSDTSELLSSPESSLHGGFSGVIMGGRKTPDTLLDSPQPSSRTSLENSKDKINIKISSNNILESDDSSSEPSFSKKETIGIGMMGSLSWKNIEPCLPRGLTPIGVGGLGGREYVRIQGGELRTGIQMSDEDSMPPLEKPSKRAGRIPKTPDNKGTLYSRKRNKLLTSESIPGSLLPPGSENYVPQVAQLHPLIDHDYCMFTEFNAQIQSSIIATTESKTKVEKKYAKKTKAVRTKAVRALITEESLKGVSRGAVEKIISKGRRGRLKKRRASKEKVTTDEEVSLDDTEEQEELIAIPIEDKTKKILEIKPSRTSERRAKLQALKDDKNYVKITGSYQDEFVYFATKNKRNRPRKSLEDQNSQLLKKQQVGGMAVFDWYKDLSKGDKTSRFGTPTTSCPSSPVPSFISHMDANGIVGSTPSGLAAQEVSLVTSGTTTTSSPLARFTPPVHESIEVADLVNDLTRMTTLGSTDTTTGPGNDMDLSSYIIGTQDIKTETTPTPPNSTDPASPASEITPVPVDMAEMAEQVREMLNSMGADELENLELKFGGVDPAVSAMADATFDGLLGGFTQEAAAPAIPNATTNNLIDLDEINDSDLLQSDLGLLDVKGATNTLKPPAAVTTILPTPETATFGFTKPLDKPIVFGDVKLDKAELFPDVAPPSAPPSSTDVSTLAAQTAPELTVVSMYWNDLPGLVLMGQQYVRLVDIHKQVLPAKDTGILKKRCQMMGLSIANCSELQRDFLVRYANAAKSKSTVIVDKEAAQTLIGFYVEPKSRPSKQAVEERGIQLAKQARAQAAATTRQLPASPSSALPKSAQTSLRPATQSTLRPVEKRVGVKSTSGVRRKRQLMSGSERSAGVSTGSNDVKRSARLRHKKVCYSEMLLGNHYDNQERKEDDSISTPPPSLSGDYHISVSGQSKVPLLSVSSEESQENKSTERLLFPEDIEIMRLKNGAKYDSLNPKEKRRLRRLREKVRKRELKRKLRERRKINRVNGRKKVTIMALALAKMAAKTQKKLQQTHLFNRKHNQEHCYAAAPESPSRKHPEDIWHTTSAMTPEISVDDQQTVKVVIEAVQSVPLVQIKVDPELDVATSTEDDTELAPVVVDDVQPSCQNSPQLLKGEPVKEMVEEQEKTTVQKTSSTAVASQSGQHRVKRPPLAVLHRDAVQRLSQRSRWQDGQLHLDAFTDRQSACISCTTCSELLTVKRFMKHMHHQKNRDELAHVTLTQTLEMLAPEAASTEDHAIWSDFQKRQAELMGPPMVRRARPTVVKSSPGSVKLKNSVKAKSPMTVKPTAKSTVAAKPAKASVLPAKAYMTKAAAKSPVVATNVNGVVSTSSNVVSSQTVVVANTTPQSSSPSTPKQQVTPISSPSLPKTSSPASVAAGKASSSKLHPLTTTAPVTSHHLPSPHTTPAKSRTAGTGRNPTTAGMASPSPLPQNLQTDTTPASSIRHSTRVRKQKQLHPIERYVFSSGVSPPTVEPPAKRPRLSLTGERGESTTASVVTSRAGGLTPTGTTGPVRKVRLRLSTASNTVKYDLRASPENAARQ